METPRDDALDAARWRSILTTARDAIVSIDGQGFVTSFNRAAEEVFGYRADDVIGQNVSLLMPAPYRDEHDEYIARYRATGEGRAVGRIRQVHARHRSGRVFPIELSVAVADPEPEPMYTAIIRDVHRVESRYHSIVEATDLLLVIVDAEGTITDCSPASLAATDLPALAGRKMVDLFDPDRRDELAAAVAATVRGETIKNLEVDLASGDHRLLLSGGPLDPHEGTGLFVGWDVTELRQAESALRAERDLLLRAERLAAVGQLAASVAHEVNNPLAGIKTLVQSLRGGTLQPEREARYFDAVTDGLERIERIVRALLDYARPQASGWQPLDANALVDDCERLLRPAFRARRVALVKHVDAAAPLMGDRHQLMQVLTNLLMNAVHVSPEEGCVEVRIAVDGPYTVLAVTDQGPGFDPALRSTAFDPFTTTKPEGEGTGLGLAVAERIVSAHGGTIRIEDRPGGGSCLVIRLPH